MPTPFQDKDDRDQKLVKIIWSNEFDRLRKIEISEMSDKDRLLYRYLYYSVFRDETKKEEDKRDQEWEDKQKQDRYYGQLVKKAIAIADSISDPLFTLDLSDDQLNILAQAGYKTVGHVVFRIKMRKAVFEKGFISALIERPVNVDNVQHYEFYFSLLEKSLSDLVGEQNYQLIGSRLIRFNYMTRGEFLEALNDK